MTTPPPGWADKCRWLRAIVARAEEQIRMAALFGGPTLIAEQKRAVAYRNLDALMAMRPPVPMTRTVQTRGAVRVSEQARRMFGELEMQINVEAARQRASRTSNDNAASASQQERVKAHGTI